jgi:iron complex outermembrane recepter protein
MSKIFLLAISLLWAGVASAQTVVSGQLFDAQTKLPAVGISVQGVGMQTGTTTDAAGRFSFPTSANRLTIRGIGYETQTIDVPDAPLKLALTPSTADLETVVVTASREAQKRTDAPVAISKLDHQLIETTRPKDIVELLNKVPGVVMTNLNNEQHMMGIRQPMNTTSAYFLYLEDGLPIRPMGVFNHNALIEMNVVGIQSLEVVRGPASSLYGPEAIGGAVNLLMLRPTAVTTAQIGIQADNYGYRRVQMRASGTLGRLGYAVAAYQARQRDSWQVNSDYDKFSLNARLDYSLSARTKLWASFSNNDYSSQTGGSVDSVAFYSRQYSSTTDFTYRKVYAKRARITLEHAWNDRAQTTLTGYWRDNTVAQNPSFAIRWTPTSTTATGEVNSNQFNSLGVVAQHSQRFGFWDSKVLVGASLDDSPNRYYANLLSLNAQLRPDRRSVERYTIDSFRPDVFLVNYQARLYNVGAWAQAEFSPLSRLRVVLGGRFDQLAFDYTSLPTRTVAAASGGSKSYNRITPKVGLTYDAGQLGTLGTAGFYANYAQGFVPPALTTLFNPNNVQGLDLQPAQFSNYEIGGWLSVLKNRLFLDWAVYQLDGRNEIVSVRLPDNSTQPLSSGQTKHRGVEYGLTYKPTAEWLIRLGGTVASHRFVQFDLSRRATDAVQDVDGREMPVSPQWAGNTEVLYRPRWGKGLRLSAEWQRMSSWYQNQINTVRYDDRGAFGARGISVVNTRIGYDWRGIELFANVLNLTNELYANNATRGNNPTDRTTFTPAAPRMVVMGIQYNFSGK